MSESIFLDPVDFWNWFNRVEENLTVESDDTPQLVQDDDFYSSHNIQKPPKKMKREGQYMNLNTTLNTTATRYKICWGRHRPGKKTKIWEGDGFITLIGNTAHISNEDGRILEDPAMLDDEELNAVKGLKELLIGKTEIMVDEMLK